MINEQQRINYLQNHIVDKIAQYIVADYSLDIPSSLDLIYNSEVYSLLQDKENGLYIQSPSYIYEMLKKDIKLS